MHLLRFATYKQDPKTKKYYRCAPSGSVALLEQPHNDCTGIMGIRAPEDAFKSFITLPKQKPHGMRGPSLWSSSRCCALCTDCTSH